MSPALAAGPLFTLELNTHVNTRIHFGPPHSEYVTGGGYTVHSQVGLGRARGRVGGLVGVPADGLLLGAGGLQLLFEMQRLVAV